MTVSPNTSAAPLLTLTGVGRAGQVGEGLARYFAAAGWSLALLDLMGDEAEARAADARTHATNANQRITAHAANLADADAALAAAAEVLKAHNTDQVNAVVCAAGGFGATGALDSTDAAAWHKQFTINLDTAFATTRAFLPAVRAAKGSFVYFGSVAATPGGSPKGIAAYAAAKSGVLTLMRAVAVDEKPNGVRANAVAPTAIRTAANMADMSDKTVYVERESVADVIAFLISPAARNVNGQVLTLA